MDLDQYHLQVKSALDLKDGAKADELINACPDPHGECPVCSVLCCPHKDPLHFHHDGCPSCSEPVEYTSEQVDAMNRGL